MVVIYWLVYVDCISVQQSSFYGYTSMLPPRYTQAVMTGESTSVFSLIDHFYSPATPRQIGGLNPSLASRATHGICVKPMRKFCVTPPPQSKIWLESRLSGYACRVQCSLAAINMMHHRAIMPKNMTSSTKPELHDISQCCRGGPSHGRRQRSQKFGEVGPCGSTSGHRQTNILITVLCEILKTRFIGK